MADINNGNNDSSPELREDVLHIVVIGEQKCGKTSFIRAFYDHHKPDNIYSDNGVSVYPCEFVLSRRLRIIEILEIPGDPAFCKEQRAPHYQNADAIVFIYAIDDLLGLEMIIDKWIPESKGIIDLRGIPVVIVGIKNDSQDDPLEIEPLGLINIRRSSAYMECSVNNLKEVNDIFNYIFCALIDDELNQAISEFFEECHQI